MREEAPAFLGGEIIAQEKKRVFTCAFACPECGKVIKVFKETEILIPASKAEKEVKYIAEKDTQQTL